VEPDGGRRVICPHGGVCASQNDVLRRVGHGLSYRRLDYWSNTGRVAWHRHVAGDRGSGVPRYWPVEEIPVMRDVTRLVAAGLALNTAFTLARSEGHHLVVGDLILAYGDAPT
jgi:hypothetical protein